MTSRIRPLLLFSIAVLVGLTLALFGYRYLRPYRYHGSLIEPAVAAPDFSLEDQAGNPYRISDQKGEIVLLFFGYTHCPDVCPVTLAQYRQIKEILGEKAERVDFVFVTVDPERDTREKVGEHVSRFDPTFLGLTGRPEDLAVAWKGYGVYQEKVEQGSAAGYLVDHSSRVYLIDAQGNLRLTYYFGTDTESLARDIEHLLETE